MKAPKTEKKYEVLPEGIYPARLYEIVHVGTVEGFQGNDRNLIRMAFELPTQMRKFKDDEPEKPMTVSADYTFSMFNKAAMRKTVEALVGHGMTDEDADDFDIEKVLGKACLLNIKHKIKKDGSGNKYHFIDSAVPPMVGIEIPQAVNNLVFYSVTEHNQQLFDTLPKFLQEKVKTSKEWKVANGTYVPETTEDDSLESVAE